MIETINGMSCMNFQSTAVNDTYQKTTPSSEEPFPVAIFVASNGINRDSNDVTRASLSSLCAKFFGVFLFCLFWSLFHLNEPSLVCDLSCMLNNDYVETVMPVRIIVCLLMENLFVYF